MMCVASGQAQKNIFSVADLTLVSLSWTISLQVVDELVEVDVRPSELGRTEQLERKSLPKQIPIGGDLAVDPPGGCFALLAARLLNGKCRP